MATIWILIANASRARIYAVKHVEHETMFNEIYDLCHPASRAKNSDLVSDAPGSYKTREATRGTFAEKTAPKEVEAEAFAHELVQVLNEGWNQQHYQKLFISASPHFEGLLRKALIPYTAHLEPCIQEFVTKDYSGATLQEIRELFLPRCR